MVREDAVVAIGIFLVILLMLALVGWIGYDRWE
jgi:hypothetical protein